jgi:hypothetical protein
MSKIADPYRCDGPGCTRQRDSDANHWWLVRLLRLGGTQQTLIEIAPWSAADADIQGVRHACGIDCMTKIVASLAAIIVDANSSTNQSGKGAEE